jgi:hypothetical protein
MVAGWKIAVAGCLCLALGACSETMPLINLPSIAKLPEKVLSKDEQQKSMKEMIEKGQTHQAEAVKQIEQSK